MDGNARFQPSFSYHSLPAPRGLGEVKFGFEERTVEALNQWAFLPGRFNNRLADVRMTLTIEFRINTQSL